MKLSADLGHETGKFYNGQKEVFFEALLGEVQTDLVSDNTNGQYSQITTNEGRWLVGQAVRLHNCVGKIRGRSEKWAKSPEYRALLLFGISEFVSPDTDQVVIDLVTGLPIVDYRRNRNTIGRLLKGERKVERPNKRNLIVDIRNVTFLPQGFAPAKPYMKPGYRVATLDLGSRTINYITFLDDKSVGSQTDSVEQGATPILRDIAHRIEEKTKRLFHSLEIVEIIKGQEVRASGKPFDVSEIVEYYRNIYLKSVITLISDVWGNATELDKLLVFGGGALLIGSQLAKRYSQATVLPNPQWATAYAQYDYARRIF